jgi:hypothetical protein
MAMAVTALGPKELKLREQRQAGGNEVARRYGVPVKKISLAQARKLFPDGKAALREPDEAEVKRRFAEANRKDVADRAAARMHAQVMAMPINAPQMVKRQLKIEQAVSLEQTAKLVGKDICDGRIGEAAVAEALIRTNTRFEQAQIRIAELETEVVTLKRELAKRGTTGVSTQGRGTTDCPVCTARREANRLLMAAKRKKRQGASR